MNNNSQIIINGLLKQVDNGLSEILEVSYPHCKNLNVEVSKDASKVNNLAFELKKVIVLLQNQINFPKP